ncbi:MAG TPA: serine/threonine-protein kinase [Planctomycetota bacterium]|nr:serine/threonine-protein kinase [Planctomycetota bacterium]
MSEDALQALVGTLVGGTFRIKAVIATGGMGTIYRATDEKLDRPVALKVMRPDLTHDPEFVERFEREAKAMASVLHPGLPIVFAYGEDQALAYMALELVDGKTLHELIQGGILSERRACGIAVQILDALAAAHERGIIHRDVKPSNVLVARRGGSDRVKLLDFGLAKLRWRSSGNAGSLTDPSILLGTPAYMAPEIITGSEWNHRVDLYSVGVVLHEMLIGKPPFAAPKIHELLRMQVQDQPLPLRMSRDDVSPELEAIVARALAKSPEDRFQTARDMAEALEGPLESMIHREETREYPVKK